ncbi:MAG: DoxX family protein [Caldilineaceae bacterium]|nr:DoxX family protein [Caldilineaceae bacterium]MCB0125480.1 DoxX family protein [Caldilineaceae bacterium]
MNVVLWILQILLAAAFAAHGWMMVAPPPELAVIMNEQLGVSFRLFIGVAELLAAVGLILPGLTRILPHLVAWAAAGLAIVTVSATVLHFSRGEISSGVTTAILLVLTAFVAYMRLQVKPIAPRAAV